MTKKKNIFVICLMAVVLYGFSLWGLIAGDKNFSMTERRNLAKFPEFTWESANSGEFMNKFETYTLDQFPMRDELRTVKAVCAYYVFRQKENNKLYMQNGYASKLAYPLSESSLEHAISCFDVVYDKYLEGKDVSIYGVIVPDKNYYLASLGGYPSLDYDKLYSVMEEGLPYMNFIDIRDRLAYDDFYKTDTHWRQEKITDVAAYISESMGAGSNVTYKENELPKPFYGVYYGQAALPVSPEKIIYLTNETLDACTVMDYETGKRIPIYALDKLNESKETKAGADLYEIFLSGSKPLLTIDNPNATTDKELVIFRDSFGSSIAPLLVEGYAKVTLVDIRYISPGYLGNFIKFDNQDVLFMYSTLVLNESMLLKKQ